MSNEPTKKLKLSVSSIGTYEKCPKKYWFSYIEKPPIPKKEWSHLELGSCLHLALEKFHGYLIEQPLPSDQYPPLMKKCLENAVKEFNQEILAPEADDMQKIMQSYLNDIKKNGLPNVLWVEKPFNFELGDYLIRGFMDRVDQVAPGVYNVVDYKTSKNPAYLTKFQLLVYAMILKHELPDLEKVTGNYILLKHDCKTKGWEFSLEDINQCMEDIKNFGDQIISDNLWEKKPSKLCDFCDYKDLCLGNWSD